MRIDKLDMIKVIWFKQDTTFVHGLNIFKKK